MICELLGEQQGRQSPTELCIFELTIVFYRSIFYLLHGHLHAVINYKRWDDSNKD